MIVNGDRPNIPEDGRTPLYGGLERTGGDPVPAIAAALGRLAAVPWWPSRNVAFLGNGRHHRPITSWYDLVERALHSWPVTLRIAVLLLVLLTGTAELAARIGLSGQTVVIVLEAWYHVRRRRVRGVE